MVGNVLDRVFVELSSLSVNFADFWLDGQPVFELKK